MTPSQTNFMRRISPLCTTQFLGVFNDNAFKMLATLAVVGGSGNYFKDSVFLMLLTFAYVIPFLALTSPAGALADHMPKRYIIMLSKVLEFFIMLGGAFVLAKTESWGVWPVLGVMFLMTGQSAFFSPAFNGILPETFPEKELSRANGDVGIMTFLGAILGMGSAPFMRMALEGNLFHCGLLLCGISFVGLLVSASIVPVISAVQRKKELAYRSWEGLKMGVRELAGNHGLLLAALGDGFFLGIGVAIQTLLILYAKYTLDDGGGDTEIGLLQLAPALGMGIGCYLAGRLSGRKVELGLVPFGAAGVALSLPIAAYFPGAVTQVSLSIPHLFVSGTFDLQLHMHITAMFWLAMAGLCGGLFIVPLRAYFQQRVRPEVRGAALACNNAICFTMVLAASLLVFCFALGTAKADPDIPEIFRNLADSMPYFSPQTLLVAIGAVTFLVTLFTMWLLPDFTLRFLIITLGHTLYKLRITGAENIPERGPAMLLSNHVSFIDGILISACTSRRVRFLMHEDYYAVPILSPVARLTGFVKVPSAGKHKSMSQMFDNVKDLLRSGKIVCVFPEGKLTRNGTIGFFKGGYEKMIPADMDIPVIPVHIGDIWGSMFSYYSGRIRLRLPRKLPYYATVTFGKPLPKKFTPFEARQAIAELGAEAAVHPRHQEHVLHYQVAKNAKRMPFKTVMRDADGKSYNCFTTFLSALLLSREIRRLTSSDCKYVGILLPNSTAAALSILGSLYADKVPCPLNFTTSQKVFELSVKKARITHVITSRRFLEKIKIRQTPEMVFLEDLVAGIPSWKKLLAVLGIIVIPYRELMNLISPLTLNDVNATGALLFSSGSTGIPKGVMLSHHNINSDVYSIADTVKPDRRSDGILGNLPLFHSFGLNTCFWIPMSLGCEVTYVASPLDAATVGNAIEKYCCTMLFSTPSFLQAYMRKCPKEQFRTLRLVISGAEKLREDVARRFHEIMEGKREVVEGYGCTELSPVVTINFTSDVTELGRIYGKKGSIGISLPNVCPKVVDPLSFKPVPPDTEGLLFVKGPMVMQGYLDEPEMTEKAVIDGFYNTGDIVKMDEDGYIFICGRLSRFSKIAGEMVPHEMVECIINELCGSDARVVAVGGIPDPAKGEALLVLYTEEMPMTPDEVVALLRERSISNLWIPKAGNFHKVDHLPLLGSGKLDLSILRQIADEYAASRARQGKNPSSSSPAAEQTA